MNHETLAHLCGYSTLALILGTADWSMFGWVFALPLVLGTLALVGYHGVHLVDNLDIRIDNEPLDQSREAATDGGRNTNRSPDNVAENVEEQADEQGSQTTGGDRNRRHSSSTQNQPNR